jgi:hypothetical protein
MILLNRVGPGCGFELERPVFIAAGEAYWIDHETSELCVDRGGGRVERVPGVLYR